MNQNILLEVPANWELRELSIRNPEGDFPRELYLNFTGTNEEASLLVKGPDSLKEVLELLETQIDNIKIVSAVSDQREGFPIKLVYETDRGCFEIWAREYIAS